MCYHLLIKFSLWRLFSRLMWNIGCRHFFIATRPIQVRVIVFHYMPNMASYLDPSYLASPTFEGAERERVCSTAGVFGWKEHGCLGIACSCSDCLLSTLFWKKPTRSDKPPFFARFEHRIVVFTPLVSFPVNALISESIIILILITCTSWRAFYFLWMWTVFDFFKRL